MKLMLPFPGFPNNNVFLLLSFLLFYTMVSINKKCVNDTWGQFESNHWGWFFSRVLTVPKPTRSCLTSKISWRSCSGWIQLIFSCQYWNNTGCIIIISSENQVWSYQTDTKVTHFSKMRKKFQFDMFEWKYFSLSQMAWFNEFFPFSAS